MSHSTCDICRQGSPKYKCPACKASSCSLPCFKQHKASCSVASEESQLTNRRSITSSDISRTISNTAVDIVKVEALLVKFPSLRTQLHNIYSATLAPSKMPSEPVQQHWSHNDKDSGASKSESSTGANHTKGSDKDVKRGLAALRSAIADEHQDSQALLDFLDLVREGHSLPLNTE